MLKGRVRFTAAALVGGSLLACRGMTAAVGPSATSFGGLYSLSGRAAHSACAPAPLPPATSSDSALYVHLGPSPIVALPTARVQQSGSDISMIAVDSRGNQHSDSKVTGTIDADGAALLQGPPDSLLEAAREGGRAFFVTHTTSAKAQFSRQIGTPSGRVVGLVAIIATADSFAFRDADSAGTVFTTCVVTDTATGSWFLN